MSPGRRPPASILAVLGIIIIVAVLLIIPVLFLISTGFGALIIGALLKRDAEAENPDSELVEYNY